MRILLAIAVAILLWAPAGRASNGEAAWLEFRPAVVTLTGRFELVLRFGPPNYGENPKTDLKMEVPTLWLAEPIRVRGKPGDEDNAESVEGIRMVQLILPNGVNAYELLDEDVVATGELTHRTRGPEFTPIIMHVKRIQPAH